MQWSDMQQQFREITKLFTVIEERVWVEGRVDAHELELVAETNALSPLGVEVLANFVRHSPKVIVREEGDDVWLEPNPEYRAYPVDGLAEEG
jgi:hypothetical protein